MTYLIRQAFFIACVFGGAALACKEFVAAASSEARASPADHPVLAPLLAGPLRDGDIIFHASQSRQSSAIALATGSVYTHVGIVFHPKGKPMVLEAVDPVKLTPLAKWVARGRGAHYVVKRLASRPEGLSEAETRSMQRIARPWLGRDYDWTFAWSDDELYCSELVWKLYARALHVELSAKRTLGDFHLDAPLVRDKIRSRYGTTPPLEAEIVAPSDLFDSKLLVTVHGV